MSIKLRSPVYVRATAIVILFAMVHYMVGYRLLYSLGILYTKDEAKQCTVDNTKNKKFTLSAAEYKALKWTEENEEFSLNNQMYDVASIKKTGTNYTITAYADDPETELVTAFHNFESALFQPDQSNKSAKSAEDIMSAFQKECTPAAQFKINVFALNRLFQPVVICLGGQSLQVSDNIWHPPTC
jgi:hypothetical protein